MHFFYSAIKKRIFYNLRQDYHSREYYSVSNYVYLVLYDFVDAQKQADLTYNKCE